MQAPAKPASFLTWIVLAIVLVVTGCIAWKRAERTEFISGLANVGTSRQPGDDTVEHTLIIPGHTNESFQWILETETLFRDHRWRLQTTSQDNAPFGRAVRSPAPYRWWLAFVTRAKNLGRATPLSEGVEGAALAADPILLLLWIAVGTFAIRRFIGNRAGVFFAVGTAFVFPFAVGFLPAAPDHHGLAWIVAAASVTSLTIGFAHASETADFNVSRKRLHRWFALSGALGAFGLWLDVSIETPILLGLVVSGLLAALAQRMNSEEGQLPWLTWGSTGALASLLFYFVENAPHRVLQTEVRVLHPLYALAWIGFAFLIDRVARRIRGARPKFAAREYVVAIFAVAAIAVFPIVVYITKSPGFLAPDLLAFRLTKLSSDTGASSLWEWLVHSGFSAQFLGTISLPVLALLGVGWSFLKKQTAVRTEMSLLAGPLLVAVFYGFSKLSWWNIAAQLSVLIIAVVCAEARGTTREKADEQVRWIFVVLGLCCLLPGLSTVVGPLARSAQHAELEDADLRSLIERDLARYLQSHADAPHAIVITPPSESVALYYYGGLRGLGSLFWENVDGVGAAVRILSASTPEEAQALVERRSVNYIVIPTWDAGMDQYARVGSGQLEGTFLELLHHWSLPNWLRPISYSLPTVNGFENQFVSVFKVEEEQSEALTLGRLADYFVDLGKPELALPLAQNLRKFPADLGAMVTRAEVALGAGDQATLSPLMQSITSRLTHNGDRFLAFDRRVELAVLLARTQQSTAAKDQVQKCIATIDAQKIRSLSVGSLYRLQVLEKLFGLRISDPQLYQLARDLLTPDLRAKL